jgi:hypothetical protein
VLVTGPRCGPQQAREDVLGALEVWASDHLISHDSEVDRARRDML